MLDRTRGKLWKWVAPNNDSFKQAWKCFTCSTQIWDMDVYLFDLSADPWYLDRNPLPATEKLLLPQDNSVSLCPSQSIKLDNKAELQSGRLGNILSLWSSHYIKLNNDDEIQWAKVCEQMVLSECCLSDKLIMMCCYYFSGYLLKFSLKGWLRWRLQFFFYWNPPSILDSRARLYSSELSYSYCMGHHLHHHSGTPWMFAHFWGGEGPPPKKKNAWKSNSQETFQQL